jgi:hypothetical protein
MSGYLDGATKPRPDVFDYIERLYNAKLRYSTIGYLSPTELENRMQ